MIPLATSSPTNVTVMADARIAKVFQNLRDRDLRKPRIGLPIRMSSA
jgi:hypothetical protein